MSVLTKQPGQATRKLSPGNTYQTGNTTIQWQPVELNGTMLLQPQILSVIYKKLEGIRYSSFQYTMSKVSFVFVICTGLY